MNSKYLLLPEVYLFVFVLLLPLIVSAQDDTSGRIQLPLSLQEAVERSLEQNFSIRQAEYDVDINRSRYRQTNAAFLPQLSIEEMGVSTNDPLNVFGYKLKQEVVTQSDFAPSQLNFPDSYDNFTTKFELRQPLLNTDAFFKRSAAKKQLEATKENLKGTLEYTQYQVKDAYYQLQLMNKQLDVIRRSLKTARENERQAKNLFEQDMINKADYLAANVRVLELESQQSKVNDQLLSVQDHLRFMLNVNEDVTIVATDSLRMRPAPSDEVIEAGDVANAEVRAMGTASRLPSRC